jgi:hypothetical protein
MKNTIIMGVMAASILLADGGKVHALGDMRPLKKGI